MWYLIYEERKQLMNRQNYHIEITFYNQNLFQSFTQVIYSASMTVFYSYWKKNKRTNKIKRKVTYGYTSENSKRKLSYIQTFSLNKKGKPNNTH
jgi:hypothetical protein